MAVANTSISLQVQHFPATQRDSTSSHIPLPACLLSYAASSEINTISKTLSHLNTSFVVLFIWQSYKHTCMYMYTTQHLLVFTPVNMLLSWGIWHIFFLTESLSDSTATLCLKQGQICEINYHCCSHFDLLAIRDIRKSWLFIEKFNTYISSPGAFGRTQCSFLFLS